MKTALLNELLAVEGVTSLVARRINWKRRPQGEGLPALVLHLISGVPDYTMAGPSGLVDSRVQVDCWAASALEADALARAVEAGVTARPFDRDGVRFDVILLVDEGDDAFDDPADPLFRTRLDLMVLHAKA